MSEESASSPKDIAKWEVAVALVVGFAGLVWFLYQRTQAPLVSAGGPREAGGSAVWGKAKRADGARDPYFRIDSTAAGDLWADPEAGVWFFRDGWHFLNKERWSEEKCKEEIRKGWGKGGWVQDIVPFLRDSGGGVWFLNSNRYWKAPYARFDGTEWVEPLLPEASRHAPPRVSYHGGPQYLPAGVEAPDGTVVLFEDLGAFAFHKGRLVYASFYDYSTYDYDEGHEPRWLPSSYVRVKPRWAVMPDHSLLVWGEPVEAGRVPEGVMRLLRWRGGRWEALTDYRGIPAERLCRLAFLPRGGAWACARPDAREGGRLPVFLPPRSGQPVSLKSALLDEKGKALLWQSPSQSWAYFLFQEGDIVYAGLETGCYALLPNGRVRAMTEEPWPRLQVGSDVEGNVDHRRRVLVLKDIAEDSIVIWDGDRLRAFDTGMRTSTRLRGIGPDGRVYLRAGSALGFAISILPGGEQREPAIRFEEAPQPIRGRHPFDERGRLTAQWDKPARWDTWTRFPFPATQVYGENGWEQALFVRPPPTTHPPRPGPVMHAPPPPPPPCNVLEEVPGAGQEAQAFISANYEAIVELLRTPEAPFYRHSLSLIEPGLVSLPGDGACGPSLFDGHSWYQLADLLRIKSEGLQLSSLFLRGERELWYGGDDEYRCLEMPAQRGSPPVLTRTIKVLDRHAALGLEGEDLVWDLGIRGPRPLARVAPERLQPKDPGARLAGVDEWGRTYFVRSDGDAITLSDGRENWRFVHPAFSDPNSLPRFALEAREGRIWCLSRMGLMVFAAPRPGTDHLELVLLEPRGSAAMGERPCFDAFGNLWVYDAERWRAARATCLGLRPGLISNRTSEQPRGDGVP